MERNKFTIEFIREEFLKRNMIILNNEYKNTKQKLQYICNFHQDEGIKEMSWNNFWYNGHHCKSCSILKNAENKKHSFEFVKSVFESRNYTLLEESYTSTHSKLSYICNVHPDKIRNISFKHLYNRGQGCKDCSGLRELTIEIVKKEFQDRKLKLISNVYRRSEKLKYICPHHSDIIQEIEYSNFYSGAGCWYCGLELKAAKLRHSFDMVKDEFAEMGLSLLEESYVNCHSPMKFICPKHPDIIQTKTYNGLHKGHGCALCSWEIVSENRIGAKHYLWTGGSEVKNYLRGCLKDWKKESMKASDYKCVISGKKFNEIHHIYPYNKIFEETLIETGLSLHESIGLYTESEQQLLRETIMVIHFRYPLGVCLTVELHDEFHSLYGYYCTPEQFYEFKEIKIAKLNKKEVGAA